MTQEQMRVTGDPGNRKAPLTLGGLRQFVAMAADRGVPDDAEMTVTYSFGSVLRGITVTWHTQLGDSYGDADLGLAPEDVPTGRGYRKSVAYWEQREAELIREYETRLAEAEGPVK